MVRWIEGGLSLWPEFRRSRHAIVQRVDDPALPAPIFIKQFLLRDGWDRLKRMVRPPRARRALLANQMITALGFRTEPVIALAEYRRFGFTWKSVLFTRELPDVHEARAVFRDPEFGLRADIPKRRELLDGLAGEIGAWHKADLHHGDLRLSNLLMQRNGDSCAFYWMDNERTRRYARMPESRRVHNLVQIILDPGVFTRTDMLRLWRAYKVASGYAPLDEKAFLRKVIERTRERRRKRGWV